MKNKIILTYTDEPAAAPERTVRLGDTVVINTPEQLAGYTGAAVISPVTPWFPPEVKPAHYGYYVVRTSDEDRVFLAHWDGAEWRNSKYSTAGMWFQDWLWYGLSSPAE